MAKKFLLVKAHCPQGPLPTHHRCTEMYPMNPIIRAMETHGFSFPAVSLPSMELGLVGSKETWSLVVLFCAVPCLQGEARDFHCVDRAIEAQYD